MTPIFMWIIAETVARTTLETLTRWCPKCGHKLFAPKEKLMAEVKCERCGASVPPAPELGRQRY
ncbi:MAG TPA: hypothetical protein VJS44_19665 [Pyrinomonadaceae bacterium]|nr:hypothetical protein [Pyrinomonadaceae bacterium]